MRWELAALAGEPQFGEPDQVAALSAHLGAVAGDIRTQIDRLRSFQSGDFWESSAGSQEAFQDVVEDLPDDLDLVATRYENVVAALDEYLPALAETKTDAEYWIQQAEAAQDEIDRAECGVQEMEDFEAQAQADADTANEEREPGDPEIEPAEWDGEDYRASLAAAQADLANAARNCLEAIQAYWTAHQRCASAIDEAGNDDLKNKGGLSGALGRAWDAAMDLVEIAVQVLDVVIKVVAVVGLAVVMLVPGVNLAMLGVVLVGLSALNLAGTLTLWADDRRTGWDVVGSTIDTATAGLSALGGTGSKTVDVTISAATGYVEIDSDGPVVNGERGHVVSTGLAIDILVDPFMEQLTEGGQGPGFADATAGLYDLVTYDEWDTLFTPRSEVRPEIDLSHITFEGLDVAVHPSEMDVPEIDLPPLGIPGSDVPLPDGPICIPPGELSELPDVSTQVEVEIDDIEVNIEVNVEIEVGAGG